MTPIVMAVTCPYCTRARSPLDIMALPGGARICISCYHQHETALLALSGLKADGAGGFTTTSPPPLECSECHISVAELQARNGNSDKCDVRMVLQYENGVYRFLCHACAATYIPKRREFYRGTEFADRMKL